MIQKTAFRGRWAQALVVGTMSLWVSGCLISAKSHEQRSGSYIAEDTFSQIEPGKTTAAWLKATLGEPNEKTQTEGVEIWKWRYTECKDSSGYVFLLFDTSTQKESKHTVFIELKDGVVVKKWRG